MMVPIEGGRTGTDAALASVSTYGMAFKERTIILSPLLMLEPSHEIR